MIEFPQMLHTVLDAERPRELAEFYRQLLDLAYRPGDEPPTGDAADDADWLVLVDSSGLCRRWIAVPARVGVDVRRAQTTDVRVDGDGAGHHPDV